VIIDNMCKLVDVPSDAAPFLPRLLPGLDRVKEVRQLVHAALFIFNYKLDCYAGHVRPRVPLRGGPRPRHAAPRRWYAVAV
jgi:hypothetical protein